MNKEIKSFHVIQIFPSPYRVHMFTEMYRQLFERGIEFHVHLMCDKASSRPKSWENPIMNFPHTYWKNYGHGSFAFNPGLILHLMKIHPDCLLIGDPYDTYTSILAAWLCRAKVRCSWVEGQTKTPGRMTGFIGRFKRLVLSKCPYVGVPGSDGINYINMHQGLTRRKMPTPIFLPNIVDERRFKPREQWDPTIMRQLREKIGIKENERFCFISARLIPVKGLIELIMLLDVKHLRGWQVMIFGDGPLRGEIEELIKNRGLNNYVKVSHFIPYEDMPKYYAAADLFMLPSLHDPNPLSVVEALHSGLPMAISSKCGNVEEGVSEGVNGWVLPVGDNERMTKKLNEIFDTRIDMLRKFGINSKTKNAEFWNSQKAIRAFLTKLIG